MARQPNAIPSYRLHKRTGRAVVTVRDHLGARRDVLLPGSTFIRCPFVLFVSFVVSYKRPWTGFEHGRAHAAVAVWHDQPGLLAKISSGSLAVQTL
jgi:hypothetical protein